MLLGKGGIDILSCGIMDGMSHEMVGILCRSGGCIVAMVLIWRLVESALKAGIDGVVFFTGVAAIAGLGGYSVRWLVDFVKAKSTTKEKEE